MFQFLPTHLASAKEKKLDKSLMVESMSDDILYGFNFGPCLVISFKNKISSKTVVKWRMLQVSLSKVRIFLGACRIRTPLQIQVLSTKYYKLLNHQKYSTGNHRSTWKWFHIHLSFHHDCLLMLGQWNPSSFLKWTCKCH